MRDIKLKTLEKENSYCCCVTLMPQKKQQFRFRIPWITPGARPATESQSRRPKQRSKSPSKSDSTDVPIQRPPFRPPGISKAKENVMVVQEPMKVGKGNDIIKHHRTSASTSGVQTEDALRRAFGADHKKQKEAHECETVERKMMFATSSSTGKDVKVVSSSDSVTRNVSSSSISFEKPPPQNHVNDTVNPTQPMNDKTVSVVTLAGDNRGATMHVGSQSGKKEGSIPIHRAYRTNPVEELETTDEEENSCSNSMEEDEAGKAFVNSNIQSMNNSIMLQGSISERDPGVRVILPQHPPQPIKPVETRKAEVKIWKAEKLSYQPVVRRRCLRGLLLEPSDSDPDDNPHKPRRHGCKFRCGGDITKD